MYVCMYSPEGQDGHGELRAGAQAALVLLGRQGS